MGSIFKSLWERIFGRTLTEEVCERECTLLVRQSVLKTGIRGRVGLFPWGEKRRKMRGKFDF